MTESLQTVSIFTRQEINSVTNCKPEHDESSVRPTDQHARSHARTHAHTLVRTHARTQIHSDTRDNIAQRVGGIGWIA